MFEYHGWITVHCKDDNTDGLKKQLKAINELAEEHVNPKTKFEIFYQGGMPMIRMDGCLDHYQSWILELFNKINAMVDHCDGMLSIKDGENPCLDDQYQTWQIADGKVFNIHLGATQTKRAKELKAA